jgi:hypothetical protein
MRERDTSHTTTLDLRRWEGASSLPRRSTATIDALAHHPQNQPAGSVSAPESAGNQPLPA